MQERRKENRRRKKRNEAVSKSEEASPLKKNEFDPYSKDDQDFSQRLGYDKLTKVIDAPQTVQSDLQEYKKNCREEQKEPLEELLEKSQEMVAGSKGSSRMSSPAEKKERLEKSPEGSSPGLEADFISSLHAKSMAQENLKHQPLPDTVDELKIKALQIKELQELKETDRAATAVGWKTFNSPGPTQCAKLRVYRPKTGAIKKKDLFDKDSRPKTSVMFNKDINEIDLALCWDLLPPRPEDEVKRPKHIDGSNGSVAPSVFTVVKPPVEDLQNEDSKSEKKPRPKTAWAEKKKLPEPTNPSAVMDIINNNAEMIDTKKKPSASPPSAVKKSPSPPDSQISGPKSPDNGSLGSKSPENSKENTNPNVENGGRKHSSSTGRSGSGPKGSLDTSIDSEKLSKHKHYRSSPNLPAITDKNHNHKHNKMMFSRPCMACEVKGSSSGSDGSRRPKSEYKMAFKAGQPGNFNGRPVTAKVSVPKPKTPFAKRSYSIGTLIPPFSLWQGTAGMEYPEHWRLASVYQHSYKPVETRKKPLIQSVYQ